MTREEGLDWLYRLRSEIYVYMPKEWLIPMNNALDMAISALSENKGEWVAQDIHNCHTNFKCSECGYIHSFMHLYGKPTADYTYCPNCGAKMVESQEIHCNCTDKEIAKSFIEDVEAVKDLLPRAESEEE